MAEETKYADLTVDELGEELEKRGLKKSGKKDELIARLEDDDTAQGGTAPEDEVVEEPVAEEAPAEEKPARRRRGSAETSTGPSASPTAPTRADGTVMVRARARYVRSAPRKARLVMDHIRGKQVDQARAILDHTPRAVSSDILKLLNSAVANAENNFELDVEDLKIDRAYVDEGPTIKRYRPRALGRATQIKKRTSHMTIELTTRKDSARTPNASHRPQERA